MPAQEWFMREARSQMPQVVWASLFVLVSSDMEVMWEAWLVRGVPKAFWDMIFSTRKLYGVSCYQQPPMCWAKQEEKRDVRVDHRSFICL